jgi:hypothetical protein
VSGHWSQLAAGALVLLLAGCSADPAQCSPCAEPGTVHVSGVGRGTTALRVCLGHDPCVTVDLTGAFGENGRGIVQVRPPLLRRAAEYDGVLVRVTATDPSGTRRARSRPLVWDDPGGVCSCSSLDVRLRLPPAS